MLCPAILSCCHGPRKGTDIARGTELGIVGDTQRSFSCGGKQFAFIWEINSQMPSDLEAWQSLWQTDSAVQKSWP